jgi:phosphate starvation-inducible PhoH-like protein
MAVKNKKNKNGGSEYKNETKRVLEVLIGDIYFNPKTDNQKIFYELLDQKEIVICSGPAGVGKSLISVFKALELLKSSKNEFYKIIICTPAVEADEKLGFLPGTAEEKLDPYIFSTMYLFNKIIGESKTNQLREQGFIQILPLAYARGINVDNSILIAEEFQNATPRQVKTLITRIGHHSKFILSGDLEQSDRYKNNRESGLYDALTRLEGIQKIGIFKFGDADVVRNPLITEVLERYKEKE